MSLSDKDLGLLCAGYTAILGFPVVPPRSRDEQSHAAMVMESAFERLTLGLGSYLRPQQPALPKIGVHELFHTTYQPFVPTLPFQESRLRLESAQSDPDVNVIVKMINGGTTTIQTRKHQTVKAIKEDITRQLNIPSKGLQLTHFGQQMSDAATIGMFMPPQVGLGKPLICCVGGEEGPYELDCSEFDPPYNYDFTNEIDDGETYIRGGKVYHRPYGWKRFAVKVLNDDRYGKDNTWLGENGIRTKECKGEWPVSYHGTGNGGKDAVNSIIDNGYNIGSGALYGPGVYTSPIIKWYDDKNNQYTAKFDYEGEEWMIMLQNRVNPEPGHLKIQEKTWAGVPFWISPLQDVDKKVFDVRPYGVLFKKCD